MASHRFVKSLLAFTSKFFADKIFKKMEKKVSSNFWATTVSEIHGARMIQKTNFYKI